MSDHLELLPAVDITEGRAVQLAQGVAGSERVYGDPVAAALRWQAAGAQWIHLVDLDAAFGRGENRAQLADVVDAVDVDVELSGWTRDDGDLYETLARLDEAGCARYVVTDVNKDGMLQGPNLALLRDVCARTS